MEHPEKLSRLNPALVDKMIRTEDAVTRGRAELAQQELRRSAPRRPKPGTTQAPWYRRIGSRLAALVSQGTPRQG
jgi:hypothetical protein